jgi:6-phosphogluconolactonase
MVKYNESNQQGALNMTKYRGFIGTYTKGESKGIYAFTLDTEKKRVEEVSVAAELGNPTYVTISKDNRFLYAVAKDGENGGVSALSLDVESGSLTPINQQMLPGASPCHVSTDSENRFVFSANYHKGTVDSHLVQENGSVGPAVSTIQHEGKGPDPRQEKPHTHFAGVTPNEKFLAVVELGTDALITYKIGEDGTLTEVSRLATRPGSGPRHLTFHPNGHYAYLMTEFSSEVIVLSYDAESGQFTEKQYISTLPADFTENNQGSAIHISGDGRFVYAGNRGHNSLAVFAVDEETGELSLVERVSSEGDWPRDFVLDPSETFIVGSNQESGNLVLFARDTKTGKLTLLQSDVKVPFAVCVKFLHY